MQPYPKELPKRSPTTNLKSLSPKTVPTSFPVASTLSRQVIVLKEVFNCPSGRLVVWDKEGKPIEPVLESSIVMMESPSRELIGPIWVRGGIPVESPGGKTYEIRNWVTLCGCGRSSNKPFCDGTHRQK